MATAPASLPPTATEGFSVSIPNDLDASTRTEATHDRAPTMADSQLSYAKWRHFFGLCLLMVTVFLWTASNFLASTILADHTYSKPYFITYVNTAFFILPLVPILIYNAAKNPGEFHNMRDGWRVHFTRYTAIKQEEDTGALAASPPSTRRASFISASQELLLGEPIQPPKAISTRSRATVSAPGRISLQETARLSLEFCILWFLANFFVVAALEYTTVASGTILTSTTSIFTLLFGALLNVERFTYRKLLGVMASLTGIVLISSMDLSGNNDENRGDFPHKSSWELFIGDTLAFVSAILYGMYAVFMKKRVGDESRVNMPLFFGLVGLINVLLLWPGLVILHITGAERFELPPTGKVWAIILMNSIASLVSDFAWAYAVLLTSPIVVTVGLSMTIPLSLIGQIILNSQTASVSYWIGACVVLSSFLFVNHESKVDPPAEILSLDNEAMTTSPELRAV